MCVLNFRTGVQVAVCSVLFGICLPTQAQTISEDVPLLENYSTFELATTGVAVVGMFTLLGFGSDIFGDPIPSMGPPDRGSVDWRFSHWANPNPDPKEKWLLGIPDLAGYGAPAWTLGVYALGTVGHAFGDDFFLPNFKHELVAFTEALSWSVITVNALKLMVGRRRPFTVRQDIDKSQVEEHEKEQSLSFPSGHSASAAVTTTFIALDLSSHLVRSVLHDAHPAIQFSLGRMLPMLVAGGLTWTVMFSRIRDQRHWLSDTLTGAIIGAGFATLFYTMHFDDLGNPRRGNATKHISSLADRELMIAPTFNQGMQFGYGFSF